MEHYSFLRTLADSWGLLAMTLFFLAIIAWAFRPGSRKTHDAIASSIFRNEAQPAADPRNSQQTEA
ncbi:cbb3-type cytochrome c oxidase subunit 3 [Pseudogemmobacter faecipullorum]|uniref:Cbb3-type cytochrome c oxidase subunit 3 n=1 Tax=Pseudogemmobacter faecipullorum TaxID=2755041 RepID=A0ABS8CJS4_9RHOB|nr:cbb3-type cytochrome c oxidase subunit 3 [Pseudogemmobacter faecipullorum]MCB5409621.1 cbb3-type cytochrome c oxidase subunit 3 [Pseudogemmobacter faecipullorum]